MAQQFGKRLKQFFIVAGIMLSSYLANPAPSMAAEVVTVRYGLFSQSVAVAELRHYAETGNASIALQNFLRYVKREEQLVLRQALQTQIPINLVALDRVLNGPIGQRFLTQVAQADDRQDGAGVQAIRAALILGTQSQTKLSILSALQAYPNQRLTINLPKALQVVAELAPQPPQDRLPQISAWQALVQYQAIVSQGQSYQGCLFGDSISSGLGNSLGEQRVNFAIGGMSTVSLIEQLQTLGAQKVQCQTVIIAIGTNDAWYHIEDGQFKQNMTRILTLVRSLSPKNIYVLPAFYSTVAASHNPELAGPIARVDEINALLKDVTVAQRVPLSNTLLQPLFEQKALQATLTTDGVHLNETGQAIYRTALQQLFTANP